MGSLYMEKQKKLYSKGRRIREARIHHFGYTKCDGSNSISEIELKVRDEKCFRQIEDGESLDLQHFDKYTYANFIQYNSARLNMIIRNKLTLGVNCSGPEWEKSKFILKAAARLIRTFYYDRLGVGLDTILKWPIQFYRDDVKNIEDFLGSEDVQSEEGMT